MPPGSKRSPQPRAAIQVELAAASGDDYELLVTAPANARDALEEAADRVGVPLTCLGRAEAGTGVVFRAAGGGTIVLRGYEHQ